MSLSRPECAAACSNLARACNRTPARKMAECCRRVLRYLAGSIEIGVVYYPENERRFSQNLKSVIADHPENANTDSKLLNDPICTNGDASFASTYKSLRSLTGIMVCCYGASVLWRSKPQTLFCGFMMETG